MFIFGVILQISHLSYLSPHDESADFMYSMEQDSHRPYTDRDIWQHHNEKRKMTHEGMSGQSWNADVRPISVTG